MIHFSGIFGLFSAFGSLISLGFLVLSIYCLVLFIQFARRGIKAFDLYIEEKERGRKE